jgi:hypothetical protein
MNNVYEVISSFLNVSGTLLDPGYSVMLKDQTNMPIEQNNHWL